MKHKSQVELFKHNLITVRMENSNALFFVYFFLKNSVRIIPLESHF